MTRPVQLTGIAWDHSRAFPPLVATAQRYEELQLASGAPTVRIRWEKRTLDEFGHMPIDQLALKFDLIVIDHPWAGFAFEKNLVHDLKPLLPAAASHELAQNSIGVTFESYCYDGRLLALPIDAATPAPSWRPDLLERAGSPPPATWQEAVALARRHERLKQIGADFRRDPRTRVFHLNERGAVFECRRNAHLAALRHGF